VAIAEDYGLARRMWHQLEPIHAVFWYAPKAIEEAAALGYDTSVRWPSYFAWRGAPLGAAGPKLVTSAFYNFSPAMVAEHVPSAWAAALPQQILVARERAADGVYRALFGDLAGSPGLAEAAGLAREAALAADTAGRTLAAANADLPWPSEPHQALWHAIGVLREHRGDGHITALLAAGLDPCEALVSFAAIGAAPEEVFASRGWTSAEWAYVHAKDEAEQVLEIGQDGVNEVRAGQPVVGPQHVQADAGGMGRAASSKGELFRWPSCMVGRVCRPGPVASARSRRTCWSSGY
jgi:hypothetical protein